MGWHFGLLTPGFTKGTLHDGTITIAEKSLFEGNLNTGTALDPIGDQRVKMVMPFSEGDL